MLEELRRSGCMFIGESIGGEDENITVLKKVVGLFLVDDHCLVFVWFCYYMFPYPPKSQCYPDLTMHGKMRQLHVIIMKKCHENLLRYCLEGEIIDSKTTFL